MTTPQMDWLDDQRRQGVLGAGFYGPTEGERRRNRNATPKRNTTPWLPPTWDDPFLETKVRCGGLVTEYVVGNGPGRLSFTYDNLRDALVDLGRYVVACNAMHRSQEKRLWITPDVVALPSTSGEVSDV